MSVCVYVCMCMCAYMPRVALDRGGPYLPPRGGWEAIVASSSNLSLAAVRTVSIASLFLFPSLSLSLNLRLCSDRLRIHFSPDYHRQMLGHEPAIIATLEFGFRANDKSPPPATGRQSSRGSRSSSLTQRQICVSRGRATEGDTKFCVETKV